MRTVTPFTDGKLRLEASRSFSQSAWLPGFRVQGWGSSLHHITTIPNPILSILLSVNRKYPSASYSQMSHLRMSQEPIRIQGKIYF